MREGASQIFLIAGRRRRSDEADDDFDGRVAADVVARWQGNRVCVGGVSRVFRDNPFAEADKLNKEKQDAREKWQSEGARDRHSCFTAIGTRGSMTSGSISSW